MTTSPEFAPWDWQRILFGNTPNAFLLEVGLRTLCVYAVFVVAMRLLGKRMTGQTPTWSWASC